MRKIREALRLCLAEGLSPRQAGIATGLPRSTVRRYVVRAVEVGLGWHASDVRRNAPPDAHSTDVADADGLVGGSVRPTGADGLLDDDLRHGWPDG
jgi:hypothetical protein